MKSFQVRTVLISLVLFLLFLPSSASNEGNHRFTLVIDAGHGGHDPGALGAYSKEKTINLNVALAFGRLVEENCPDVKVVYTRHRDVFIPLQRRADIANDAKADLFVSIHTNALPAGRIAYGAETYTLGMAKANDNLAVAKRENAVITLESDYKHTYEGFDPNKAESYVIFEILQDRYMKQSVEMARYVQRQFKAAGRADKGVHQAGFLVLRNTTMPSVLTELGFITTPAEEAYLNSKSGQAEMSRSLYNGFLAYRRVHDRTARDLPADLPSKVEEVAESRLTVLPESAVREDKSSRSRHSSGSNDTPTRVSEQPIVPEESQDAKKEETEKPSSEKTAPSCPESRSVAYRIQVAAGRHHIRTGDAQFKGLPVKCEHDGTVYRYFTGSFATFAEAQAGLKDVKAKIPAAFIAATYEGKPIPLSEARRKERGK